MNWRIEQRAKLPGSHLKSSLTYPNGLTAAWSYEPTRDLLTQVVNAQPDGTVISSYTYTNDLLGHRTSKNDEQYGYNIRDELRMYRELYDILEKNMAVVCIALTQLKSLFMREKREGKILIGVRTELG